MDHSTCVRNRVRETVNKTCSFDMVVPTIAAHLPSRQNVSVYIDCHHNSTEVTMNILMVIEGPE
jgi:hypothetical protein